MRRHLGLLVIFLSYISDIYSFKFGRIRCSSRIKSETQRYMDVASEATEPSRRKHKNKYADFSKSKADPLLETIEKVKQVEKEKELVNTFRATTIPTAYGSDASKPNKSKATAKEDEEAEKPSIFIDPLKVNPLDPSTYGFQEVGRVLGPHGIKGELKVDFADTEFTEEKVLSGQILYLKKPTRRSPRAITVLSGRRQQDSVYLVAFQHITSRLHAAALKGYVVYSKAYRPKLQEEEYLIRDIVGCQCFLPNSTTLIGIVEGVVPPDELCSPSAAALMHSMLEVRFIGKKDHCLVPFVPSIVLEVYLNQKKIVMSPPKGLLDLTYIIEDKSIVRGYLAARIDRLSKEERKFLENKVILLYPEGGAYVPFL